MLSVSSGQLLGFTFEHENAISELAIEGMLPMSIEPLRKHIRLTMLATVETVATASRNRSPGEDKLTTTAGSSQNATGMSVRS